MKAYIFFSVYEELFHRIAERLRGYGVTSFSGFVWGQAQAQILADRGIDYDPLVVFTRDLLPRYDDGQPPDLEWLARRERELGVSIQRMIASERHLLAGRTYEQTMRMAEVGLREIAATYDRVRPDFIFSEDISCFHSYAHFVLARERGIPFWCIGSARMPNRLMVYSAGLQHWEQVEKLYPELLARGLSSTEREQAEKFLTEFRERPARPTGMERRAKPVGVDRSDVRRFRMVAARYLGDPNDPTVASPLQVMRQRLRRMVRVRAGQARKVFEEPVAGEKYVLYPIHFQPEASTLVQAPLYVDQLALLTDVAKSLPVGYRLYVKEHVSNRGRRPIAFYEAIRALKNTRLLGPDTNTWSLIRGASAVVVITGTMGWEGVLFDKPVITFGDVFYNILPHVYRGREVPKDGWYELFKRAIEAHRPDQSALLALISAMLQTSHPGKMHNPESFPEVLVPENIEALTTALASEVGLKGR